MFAKKKTVRLTGKTMADLVKFIYERDGGCCVRCGRYVAEGTKPHHEPFTKQGGQDRKEDMFLLCMGCHQMRHFSSNGYGIIIRDFLMKLKGKLYGETDNSTNGSVQVDSRNDDVGNQKNLSRITRSKIVSSRAKKESGCKTKPAKSSPKKVRSSNASGSDAKPAKVKSRAATKSKFRPAKPRRQSRAGTPDA